MALDKSQTFVVRTVNHYNLRMVTQRTASSLKPHTGHLFLHRPTRWAADCRNKFAPAWSRAGVRCGSGGLISAHSSPFLRSYKQFAVATLYARVTCSSLDVLAVSITINIIIHRHNNVIFNNMIINSIVALLATLQHMLAPLDSINTLFRQCWAFFRMQFAAHNECIECFNCASINNYSALAAIVLYALVHLNFMKQHRSIVQTCVVSLSQHVIWCVLPTQTHASITILLPAGTTAWPTSQCATLLSDYRHILVPDEAHRDEQL